MIRICTNCGRAFSRKNLYCPYCGMTPYNLGRICPRGHVNPREATFCGICGSEDLSQVAPRPPFWRKLVVVLLLMPIIGLLCLLLASLFSSIPAILSYALGRISHVFWSLAIYFVIALIIYSFLPKGIRKKIR